MVRGLVKCNSLRNLNECQLIVMGSSRAELKVLEGEIDFVLSSNEGSSGLNEFVGKS